MSLIYATTYSLAQIALRFTVVIGLRSEGLFYSRFLLKKILTENPCATKCQRAAQERT